MNEILTMDSIKARYAPGWVLICEPETDENLKLLSGRVLFQSLDRDSIYQGDGPYQAAEVEADCLREEAVR